MSNLWWTELKLKASGVNSDCTEFTRNVLEHRQLIIADIGSDLAGYVATYPVCKIIINLIYVPICIMQILEIHNQKESKKKYIKKLKNQS